MGELQGQTQVADCEEIFQNLHLVAGLLACSGLTWLVTCECVRRVVVPRNVWTKVLWKESKSVQDAYLFIQQLRNRNNLVQSKPMNLVFKQNNLYHGHNNVGTCAKVLDKFQYFYQSLSVISGWLYIA